MTRTRLCPVIREGIVSTYGILSEPDSPSLVHEGGGRDNQPTTTVDNCARIMQFNWVRLLAGQPCCGDVVIYPWTHSRIRECSAVDTSFQFCICQTALVRDQLGRL